MISLKLDLKFSPYLCELGGNITWTPHTGNREVVNVKKHIFRQYEVPCRLVRKLQVILTKVSKSSPIKQPINFYKKKQYYSKISPHHGNSWNITSSTANYISQEQFK